MSLPRLKLQPSPGSVQSRRYVMAREHGHARADAAAFAGISLSEAAAADRDLGLNTTITHEERN